MKFGFDFHNVIDKKPEMFSQLSHLLVAAKIEVHIITGAKHDYMIPLLKHYNIAYTHFFSIVEEAERNDIPVKWDINGEPWVNPEFWDRSKARYCKEQGIDLHIDDNAEYAKYFKTPFALFKA